MCCVLLHLYWTDYGGSLLQRKWWWWERDEVWRRERCGDGGNVNQQEAADWFWLADMEQHRLPLWCTSNGLSSAGATVAGHKLISSLKKVTGICFMFHSLSNKVLKSIWLGTDKKLYLTISCTTCCQPPQKLDCLCSSFPRTVNVFFGSCFRRTWKKTWHYLQFSLMSHQMTEDAFYDAVAWKRKNKSAALCSGVFNLTNSLCLITASGDSIQNTN